MKRVNREKLLVVIFLTMLFALGVLLVMSIANKASAQDVSSGITWEQPLAYEDGSAMPESEIDGFEVHYTVNSPFKPQDKPVFISGKERQAKIVMDLKPSLEPAMVRMAVRTRSIYGNYSDFSNVIENTFTVNNTLKPQAPIVIDIKVVCVDSTCKVVYTNVEPEE